MFESNGQLLLHRLAHDYGSDSDNESPPASPIPAVESMEMPDESPAQIAMAQEDGASSSKSTNSPAPSTTSSTSGKHKHHCPFCDFADISPIVVGLHEVEQHPGLRHIRTCFDCNQVSLIC